MNNTAARHIVITSIFPPTEAVAKFAAQPGYELTVVGDRKSPVDWRHDGVRYLSVADQEASDHALAKRLPWNHYCRKMIGYLDAMRRGAEVIVDTDDDNIPKPGWSVPAFDGRFETTSEDRGFVNVYRSFTDMHIWPRGYPLDAITQPQSILGATELAPRRTAVGVWQGLADGDPDVDAIYRLTDDKPCHFTEREPLVLARGTLCPFNSQNTAYRSELFALLYLPARVTFRFTDILRGLVAQPLMWAAGYHLGFTSATVFQERNPHDYLKDFESEIPCYLHPRRVVEIAGASAAANRSVSDNLYEAYDALRRVGIVPEEEMEILSAWLDDVARAARPGVGT